MSLDGDKMEDLRVVSVSTGTKCINGEHMSVNGNSLNGKNLVLKRICKLASVLWIENIESIWIQWIYDINVYLDCHAEIISRRCLLEFLYKQLELFENGNPAPSSIFESNVSDVDGTVNGYRLKVSLDDLFIEPWHFYFISVEYIDLMYIAY